MFAFDIPNLLKSIKMRPLPEIRIEIEIHLIIFLLQLSAIVPYKCCHRNQDQMHWSPIYMDRHDKEYVYQERFPWLQLNLLQTVWHRSF